MALGFTPPDPVGFRGVMRSPAVTGKKSRSPAKPCLLESKTHTIVGESELCRACLGHRPQTTQTTKVSAEHGSNFYCQSAAVHSARWSHGGAPLGNAHTLEVSFLGSHQTPSKAGRARP